MLVEPAQSLVLVLEQPGAVRDAVRDREAALVVQTRRHVPRQRRQTALADSVGRPQCAGNWHVHHSTHAKCSVASFIFSC